MGELGGRDAVMRASRSAFLATYVSSEYRRINGDLVSSKEEDITRVRALAIGRMVAIVGEVRYLIGELMRIL